MRMRANGEERMEKLSDLRLVMLKCATQQLLKLRAKLREVQLQLRRRRHSTLLGRRRRGSDSCQWALNSCKG